MSNVQSSTSQPRVLTRRFVRLSGYNIASNLTVPLAALVDTAMLGHLPDIRILAGVALAAVLFEYVYWSFGFLRMGTTGITAQAVGRGDRPEVYLTLYRALGLGLLFGLSLVAAQELIENVGFAILVSPETGVEIAGRQYFSARIWGAPAVLANYGFLGWFLGREEGRAVLFMTLIANLANVGLDYLFIVRFGWAAGGAGAATAISQYLMLLVAILLFVRSRDPYRPSWSEIAAPDRLRELVSLNRDLLIRTVALITTFALFTNMSALLGTVALAANAILLRIQMLVAFLVDGCAFAAEALAGALWGAGRRDELERLRRLAIGAGVAATVPFSIVLLIEPNLFLAHLTTHQPTLAVARELARWLIPVLTVGSVAYIYDGLFIGLTAGHTLRSTSLWSTLLGFLPVAFLALWFESSHLLWTAMLAYMLARAIGLHWAYRKLGLSPSSE